VLKEDEFSGLVSNLGHLVIHFGCKGHHHLHVVHPVNTVDSKKMFSLKQKWRKLCKSTLMKRYLYGCVSATLYEDVWGSGGITDFCTGRKRVVAYMVPLF
jgi:hypothetical protein